MLSGMDWLFRIDSSPVPFEDKPVSPGGKPLAQNVVTKLV